MTRTIQSYIYMCYQPGGSMAVLPTAYHGRFCPNEQVYAKQQHISLPPEITLLCCAVIADCSRDTNFVSIMSVSYFSTAV